MKKFLALVACLLILACHVHAKPKAKYVLMLFEPETAWTVEDSLLRIEVNFSNGVVNYFPNPIATIRLFNTTEDVVFVDQSQCFISRNDKSQTLWDNTQTITTTGSSAGGSVSIQGISIGGTSGSSTTTVNQAEKIISIAPLSSEDIIVRFPFNLSDFMMDFISDLISDFILHPKHSESSGDSMYRGQITKCQKSDSLVNISFFVKYSDKQDFSDTRKQRLSFWTSEMIGTKRAFWDGEKLKKELSEYGRQDIDPSLHCINLKLE